jgi:hypothetical protein
MFDGLCQEEPPPKKAEIEDGPPMSERDRAKLERRRRKDERQREVCESVDIVCLCGDAAFVFSISGL